MEKRESSIRKGLSREFEEGSLIVPAQPAGPGYMDLSNYQEAGFKMQLILKDHSEFKPAGSPTMFIRFVRARFIRDREPQFLHSALGRIEVVA